MKHLTLFFLLTSISISLFSQNVLIEPNKISTEDLEVIRQKDYNLAFGLMANFLENDPLDLHQIAKYKDYPGPDKPADLDITGITSKKAEVIAFDIKEEINQLPKVCVLWKINTKKDQIDMLGEEATFSLFNKAGVERIFEGVVTMSQYVGYKEEYYYLITIEPSYYPLSINENFKVFQELDLNDIATEIFGLVGLQSPDFVENTPVFSLKTQYEETDLDFITRVAADYGLWYYLESNTTDPKMVFVDGLASNLNDIDTLVYDGPNTSTDSLVATRIFYTGTGTAIIPGKNKVLQYRDQLGSATSSTYLNGGNNFQTYRLGNKYISPVELGEASENLALMEEHEKRTWFAWGNYMETAPGYLFYLDDTFDDELSDEYLITAVHHSGFIQDKGGNEKLYYSNTFEYVNTSTPFRKKAKEGHKKVNEITHAVVTGPEGETRHVDEHGRVQVYFVWYPSLFGEEGPRVWVPIMKPSHGSTSGFSFIPEIGDEVLISFINGDPDRPIIIGSVPNQLQPTHKELPQNKNTDFIISATGTSFPSEISMNSTENAESVGIKSRSINLDPLEKINLNGQAQSSTQLGNGVNSYGSIYADNQIAAWGFIRAAGSIYGSFGLKTLVKNSTGVYTITTDVNTSSAIRSLVVSPEIDNAPTTAGSMRIASFNFNGNGTFEVYINDGNGTPVDNDFTFILTGRE
ncbi:type VI secretion system Vgr family protein [Jiulongibacter sp. NS-SX5]|uniref:type VI secretion system Vgr family protein n=1 Tax=Jiulongibacter sp. NS-SX5 TaxID=3463854 RepID=UPI00405987E7